MTTRCNDFQLRADLLTIIDSIFTEQKSMQAGELHLHIANLERWDHATKI